MKHPVGRFVKLQMKVAERPGAVRMTFLPATQAPTIDTHGVLADVCKTDPARAKLLEQRLGELVRRNDELFRWLEASPRHTALFVENPVAAMREALPELSPDFFDGWKHA